MRLGSLFTGTGGLELGLAEVLDFQLKWTSDIEPGPNKIIDCRFPGIPNLGDITKFDWADVEPVDIITGGTPCQDMSVAGRRRGMLSGTRSGLWEYMRQGIEYLKPQFVVWENVKGARSARAYSESDMEPGSRPMGNLKALGRVLGDLTDLGYDTQWTTLRASTVGAPHHRDRIFVLAHRRDLENTHSIRDPRRGSTLREGGKNPEAHGTGSGSAERLVDWGPYAHLIERWENLTRPCPEPLEPSRHGNRKRLTGAFVEWVMGLPEGWVTDVPGITRPEVFRALGNAVVPQQASTALYHLLETSKKETAS